LQLVAVLALIALFTHNHLFWIAALLLALIEFPDFSTPIRSMASSLRKIAGLAGKQAEPAPSEAAPAALEAHPTPTRPHPVHIAPQLTQVEEPGASDEDLSERRG
jgi:hypothetical protein